MLRSRGSWKRPACLWEGFRNPKRENNPLSLTNAIFPKKIRNLGIKKLRQTPKVILLHLETVPHPEIEPISLFKILKLRWSAVSAGKRGFDQSTEHFHFPRKAASRDKTQRDLKWVNLIVFAGIYTFSSLLESNIILLVQTCLQNPVSRFMDSFLQDSIFTIIEAGSTFENMEIQDLRLT